MRGKIETNQWYDIKVELKGESIRCFLNGKLIHEATADKDETFFATAGRDEATGDIVIKAINYDKQTFQANLNLKGLSKVQSQAKLVVLTADDVVANNSLEQPTQVMPLQATIHSAASMFTHEFPAHSLSVIRLKTR